MVGGDWDVDMYMHVCLMYVEEWCMCMVMYVYGDACACVQIYVVVRMWL